MLDPFSGSGTAMIDAMNSGRHAVGIGMESKHCKLAVERITKECRGLFAGEGGVMRIISKIKNAYTLCKRKVTAFV